MAAATPKTPSDAQPTSENITYEATLNAAASASRFPAGAFLARPEKDESGAGLNLAFHERGGLADSRRRATARLWRRAPRGSAAAIAFQPEVCCSVWNASLSEALRRLGYYARRVNSPLSVPRAP